MTPDLRLPSHSSAVEEKLERQHKVHSVFSNWTRPLSLPIPGVKTRRLRILVPNAAPFNYFRASTKIRRKRGPVFVVVVCVAVFCTLFVISKSPIGRSGTEFVEQWSGSKEPFDPPTLVFEREDLQRIWKWEVASGHYPSSSPIPAEIRLSGPIYNPALAPHVNQKKKEPTRLSSSSSFANGTETLGVGPKRVYLDIQSQPPNVAYPPRPVPGSVADLDHVMEHCDFSRGKYVRDCLEILRMGGGLDNGQRMRRDENLDWRYIFMESTEKTSLQPPVRDSELQAPLHQAGITGGEGEDPNEGLVRRKGAQWEPHLKLPPTGEHKPSKALPVCDPENPRVFHMFWTGPFTDKPYLALLSFLYTQNTGIHLKEWPSDAQVCRPQFWLWINPGPAAAVPNPSAVHDMYEQLKSSPWASPFLHPRFKNVIQFKLWNTTEQLDAIPEIKDEWRTLQGKLFKSGGRVVSYKQPATTAAAGNETSGSSSDEDEDLANRTGSKSSSSYDRLSVILSDMARFVLCHRFGGIYLDADTIFLRDWEELWGWTGAFAYRWSRLEDFNTAVLRMHKGSALGSFLFRTALQGGLDFHPMTVTRYIADSHLNGLLLRLPDALFDAAWLNTEEFQRDRPPQPYFTQFSDFFDTPAQNSASPQALGINGFFKGSYSYHFHNFWWKPFDATRNYPDLGKRFQAGEEKAKAVLRKEKLKTKIAAGQVPATALGATSDADSGSGSSPLHDAEDVEDEEPDKRDLDWSTVLKRTFEAYIRGERPNMYGEWIEWRT
ncbi:glycosyltransferase family 32 protein [Agrocybe pediades]|nr:glycosyltransferase family 32 protein [Agrocybe pediades]